MYGCVKQLYKLKQANRHLKVLASIGGWTYSPNFAPAASTAIGRTRFAATAVKLMKDWGFDGIDIDWEHPSTPTEVEDFLALLAEVRRQLDEYAAEHAPGYRFLLTIASSAGPDVFNSMRLGEASAHLDFLNIMAYDFAGSWGSTVGHQANLYADPANPANTPFSADGAVNGYVAAGVPVEKLVLGMPAYGRSFQNTDGLGTSFNGTGAEEGVPAYNGLPKAGAEVFYDAAAGATYSYDAATREWISFDTKENIARKVEYLKAKGLSGGMFWEAALDKTGSESLISTSAATLGNLHSTQNLISYPDSVYDNLRAGFPAV